MFLAQVNIPILEKKRLAWFDHVFVIQEITKEEALAALKITLDNSMTRNPDVQTLLANGIWGFEPGEYYLVRLIEIPKSQKVFRAPGSNGGLPPDRWNFRI